VAKVAAQTALLEQTFACPITSHRAGRWGFDGEYARAVSHHGYIVDCSVTPGVSWRSSAGQIGRAGLLGGASNPYFLDFNDVCKPGGSALLEAPMTIVRLWPAGRPAARQAGLPERGPAALNRLMPPLSCCAPTAGIPAPCCAFCGGHGGTPAYVEFMLHSSGTHAGRQPHLPGRAVDRPAVSPDAHPFRSGARPVRAADTERVCAPLHSGEKRRGRARVTYRRPVCEPPRRLSGCRWDPFRIPGGIERGAGCRGRTPRWCSRRATQPPARRLCRSRLDSRGRGPFGAFDIHLQQVDLVPSGCRQDFGQYAVHSMVSPLIQGWRTKLELSAAPEET